MIPFRMVYFLIRYDFFPKFDVVVLASDSLIKY